MTNNHAEKLNELVEAAKALGAHSVLRETSQETIDYWQNRTAVLMADFGFPTDLDETSLHANHVNWCAGLLRTHGYRCAADGLDEAARAFRGTWVSLADRMPPDGETVMAYVAGGGGDPYFCTIRARVIRNMLQMGSMHAKPTHWRALPAAPL